jgi:hypothetical protein
LHKLCLCAEAELPAFYGASGEGRLGAQASLAIRSRASGLQKEAANARPFSIVGRPSSVVCLPSSVVRRPRASGEPSPRGLTSEAGLRPG